MTPSRHARLSAAWPPRTWWRSSPDGLQRVIAQTVLPLANEAQIPLLSPTATSTQPSGNDDYFLRVIPSTAGIGVFHDHGPPLPRPDCAAPHPSGHRHLQRCLQQELAARLLGNLRGRRRQPARIPVTFITDDGTDFDTLARRTLAGEPEAAFTVAGALDTAMPCEAVLPTPPDDSARRGRMGRHRAPDRAGRKRGRRPAGRPGRPASVGHPELPGFSPAFKRYGREPDFAAIKASTTPPPSCSPPWTPAPRHMTSRTGFSNAAASRADKARSSSTATGCPRRHRNHDGHPAGQWESSEP